MKIQDVCRMMMFSSDTLATVQGVPPLSLTGSKRRALKNYRIYGNTQRTITIDGVRYPVPDDVTLVDSVTANGANFNLDLGIVPKLNTRARVVFTPLARNNSGYFGARKDSANVRFSVTTFSTGYQFAFALTRNTWSSNKTSLNVGTRYDCTAYNGKQIINGTERNETVLPDLGNIDVTFKICAPDASGRPSVDTTLNAKYELVHIWEGDTPVLLALPAIRNNVVGVYDFVSKSFIAPTVGTLTAGKITRTENFHSDIPAELYEEVEYIESSGTQWIDTLIVPNYSESVKPYIRLRAKTNNYTESSRIFGCSRNDKHIQLYNNSTERGIQWLNTTSYTAFSMDNNFHTYIIDFANLKAYEDGVSKNLNATYGSINLSMYLFARNTDNTANSGLKGEICEFEYDDGTQHIDLVSVKRLSDNQYGMYDRVTSTFFANAGTGAFTGGDARQIEVPLCEYESVGERTENLFDEDAKLIQLGMSKQGGYFFYDGSFKRPLVNEGLPNQISLRFEGRSNDSFRLQIVYTDNTSQVVSLPSWRATDEVVIFTSNASKTVSVIKMDTSGNPMIYIKHLDIVSGSTAPTEHIPYGYRVPIAIYNFKQLEYIQSSGTQFIDTGFNATSENLKISIKCSNSVNSKNIFGFAHSSSDSNWWSLYRNGSGDNCFYCGATSAISAWSDSNVHKVEIESKSDKTLKIYVDDALVYNGTYSGSFISNTHGNFYLFSYGGHLQPAQIAATGIMEYCKIWQDNVLVRDFVPAKRQSDNAVGMYDKVTNTFQPNAGTGSFVAGPEVVSSTPIYLSAPLAKVSDADYIDYARQIWHRKIGVKVFDGTENWRGDNNIVYIAGARVNWGVDYEHRTYSISSHFVYSENISILGIRFDRDFNINAYKTIAEEITDITSFKAWLAAQYAAGTPVTVYYPLATPVETPITLPSINALAGGCSADAHTTVKPSNMIMQYVK